MYTITKSSIKIVIVYKNNSSFNRLCFMYQNNNLCRQRLQ